MDKNLLLTIENVMNLTGYNEPTIAHHIKVKNLRVHAISGEEPVAPSDLRGLVRTGPKGWTSIKGQDHKGDIWVTKDNIAKMPLGQIIHNLPKCIFTREDVLEFTEKHGLGDDEERKALLPCKAGTKWEDITITLLSDDTEGGPGLVRIRTAEGEGRFTYHELGFQHKQSPDKPTKLWDMFKLFAIRTGFVHSENIPYDGKLTDTAKRLNKHLKQLFGIQDSIYTGHYKKEGGYRTKIRFEDNTFK